MQKNSRNVPGDNGSRGVKGGCGEGAKVAAMGAHQIRPEPRNKGGAGRRAVPDRRHRHQERPRCTGAAWKGRKGMGKGGWGRGGSGARGADLRRRAAELMAVTQRAGTSAHPRAVRVQGNCPGRKTAAARQSDGCTCDDAQCKSRVAAICESDLEPRGRPGMPTDVLALRRFGRRPVLGRVLYIPPLEPCAGAGGVAMSMPLCFRRRRRGGGSPPPF